MCKPSEVNNAVMARRDKTTLLLTESSFYCTDEKGEKGPLPPSQLSTWLTIVALAVFLMANEQFFRVLITKFMTDLHPVMETERHRFILARHIGVDATACLAVAALGIKNWHLISHLMTFKVKKDESMSQDRIYRYHPQSHRVLVFFLAYQVKNLHDTIVWEDGAIFVAHHIFAGLTAWFGMYPGVASLYGLFFMGISEISTCVLCLLANFDPHFGVIGLEEAFPITKVVLAVAFVILFLICRIFVWPVLSYHFLTDSLMILKRNTEKETKTVKNALKFMVVSNVGLTLLQILWLGEIISTAQEEIEKLL